MNKSVRIKDYLSLVKFSHTIFAFPFAIIGFFMGTADKGTSVSYITLLLIVLCMVFGRNAAMSFNRYIDRHIDKRNPRTSNREIPSNIISERSAILFFTINSLLFVITTIFINTLCFFLSFVALFVILVYSYTKRFTALCHIVLGLSLSLAPIGAYIAVTGHFDIKPILLAITVLLWVSGFDILYSLQDIDFDKQMKLKSIPVSLGYNSARYFSYILHILSILILFYFMSIYGGYYAIGYFIFSLFILYQHYVVYKYGLRKINLAFMTVNGIASIIFGIFFSIELLC